MTRFERQPKRTRRASDTAPAPHKNRSRVQAKPALRLKPAPGHTPAPHGKRQTTGEQRRRRPQEDKAPTWTPGPGARVVRAEAGLDLARFIAKAFGGGKLSRNAARNAIEKGSVRVNGRVESFHSRTLAVGDVVECFLPDAGEHTFDPARVLMNRDGVIAYDKPAWLAVTRPDRKGSWSLFDILREQFPDVIAVHRLDADTSGIVLFARNATIAHKLETMFRDHSVEKEYTALVRGHPRESGLHRSYLVLKDKSPGRERWVSGRGADAREAVTEWTVTSRIGSYASLVQVRPKTGRHHQIRLHFSEMGCPLYGDRIYGDRGDPVHVPRHMLHAGHILLPHPGGGERIDLSAPLPPEFAQAMAALRRL